MAKLLFKKGIITKATHDYCVRLSPALVVNKEEIDWAHERIEEAVHEMEKLQ